MTTDLTSILEIPCVAHHPAAVTSNEASMTSWRPDPTDAAVSLASGAPRRNRTGDPILTMDALYRLS